MSLPAGVVVSIDCWSRYRSTPQASSVWIVPSRSIRLRPTRSILRHDDVELAPGRILEHLVEAWTSVAALGAADTRIAVLLDDVPATPFGDLAQGGDLVLDRLLVG